MASSDPNLSNLPTFMTADDLATLFSVKRRTIYDWCDQGLLRARRVGRRRLRFTPRDVEEFLDKCEALDNDGWLAD
jgi:excisionase family DNA binding protein